MDSIIQQFDFLNATSDSDDALQSQLNRWKHENDKPISKPLVTRSLDAAMAKVCVPSFPGKDSNPGSAAQYAFEMVLSLMSDAVDEGQITAVESHNLLLNCLIKLLSCGPGTTHLNIIILITEFSEFCNYTQVLKGEKLKKYLNALKREYTTQEKISSEDYASSLKSALRSVVDFGFESDQIEANLAVFIEFFIYFELGSFPNSSREVISVMHQVSDWIDYKTGRKIFKKIKDPATLKDMIVRYQAMICTKAFPADEKQLKSTKSSLKTFLDGLSESLQFEAVCNVFMDFCVAVCNKPGEKVPGIVKAIGDFFYHIEEKAVKNKHTVFVSVIKKTTEIVKNLDPEYKEIHFANVVASDVLVVAMDNSSKEHATLLVDFIKTCLRVSNKSHFQAAYHCMHAKQMQIKWKDQLNSAKEIFIIISETRIPEGDNQERTIKALTEFTDNFLESVTMSRIISDLLPEMTEFVISVLESRNLSLFPLAKEVTDQLTFNVKQHKAVMMRVFTRLAPLLQDDTFPWFDLGMEAFSLGSSLVSTLIDGIKDSKILTMEDLDVLIELLRIVMEKEFYDPNTAMLTSIFYITYVSLGTSLLRWLDNLNEIGRASSLIPSVIKLVNSDEDQISLIAGSHLNMISNKSGQSVAPHLDSLIQTFLDKENPQILAVIDSAYNFNPKGLTPHFENMFSFIDSGNAGVKTHLIHLLLKVATKQPELFSEEVVSEVMKEAWEDPQTQILLLQVLERVAQRYPDRLAGHMTTLMNFDPFEEDSKSFVVGILKNMGYYSEKYCGAVLKHFSKMLQSSNDEMMGMLAIDGLRVVGSKHKEELEKHRKTLEEVKQRSSIQPVKDGCQQLLDFLEGRSLEGITVDLQQQQDELGVLDTKVTQTKKEVKVIEKDVRKHGEEVKVVKHDLKEHGERIQEIDETVQETAVKVDEIDSKTLSHAPFWSRDVSKLLNPRDDHDWRLLSSRLGYGNDDIRAWAQQADPCMAMLNEWYTLHKTSEATLAVLNNLQEMSRLDAAAIVENAMKMAEKVVEDEDFEYKSPPQIFLSYQWGYQNEVKVLARHLEMAGYDCWLDVGQMGGGDKLFEKIDNGVRGAKVVISCVTEKYAKSPNCNREVNLTVNLSKPLIPLLMERLSWPPPGSMGPIFSEYLFIRFYSRADTGLKDDRYWEPEKFQELLMQLSFHNLVRNEKKIAPQYKNWWLPVDEVVVVDKKRNKGDNHTPAVTETKDDGVSPEVFISYQWGKQKQVMKLYRRLRELGFACWMDIHQMGGGDSLFDKIDRGVRGCRVVVTCLTTKYTLSANCRREVSLADALNKPMIPLLLESMSWPPAGPMSLSFTQLLYIDFSSDEGVQDRWTGPQFDQMVGKIREIVPVQMMKSSEQAPDKEVDSKSSSSQKRSSTGGPRPPPSQKTGKISASKQSVSRTATKNKKEVLKSTNEKLQQSNPEGKQFVEQPQSTEGPKPTVKSGREVSRAPQNTEQPSEETKSKSCLIL